jgi:integrase
MRAGKSREMGLGSAADVSLQSAREMRDLWRRRMRNDKIDPIDNRRSEARQRAAKDNASTFRSAAEQYLTAHRATWRNEKHRAQWESTLIRYVYPTLGEMPAHQIDEADVLSVLRPIWSQKPETASRVRGRIECVLGQPEVRKLRQGENPARWRGNLDGALPSRRKVRRVRHHAALAFDSLPEFFVELYQQCGDASAALEFLILTAARTGEVIGMRWNELDLGKRVWIVPAERMKGGNEHRVPLSDRAMEIMSSRRPADGSDFVFAGRSRNRPMSNMAMSQVLRRMGREEITVHGFRSCFRDWAAERTNFANEIAEMALAHSIGNDVESAYRRGDLLEKRRKLMAAWALFALSSGKSASVTRLVLSGR